MGIPGFTAALSLASGAREGNMAAEWGRVPEVVPAILSTISCVKMCDGDPDCIYCCRCVRAGGHPSHCCL
jgi:hypothetical protein